MAEDQPRAASEVQRVMGGRMPTVCPPYVREKDWEWLRAHVEGGVTMRELADRSYTTPTTIRHHLIRTVENMLNRGDLIVDGAPTVPGRRIRISDVDPSAISRRADYAARLREAAFVNEQFRVISIQTTVAMESVEPGIDLSVTFTNRDVPVPFAVGNHIVVNLRRWSVLDLPTGAEHATPTEGGAED